MKRIAFKCAFGGEDGWGHVVRCSALAGEFRRRGWETILWSDGDLDGLPEDVAVAFSGGGGAEPDGASILVVDEMYTEQVELERLCLAWRARNAGGVAAGIDDMQRRSMRGFDLVLNTEIGLRAAAYEARSVLLGERFALLRPGFAEPRIDLNFEVEEGVVPVLVMMGGTDPFGYLPKVLQSLREIEGIDFAPVVVGAGVRMLGSELGRFAESRALSGVGAAELAGWMRVCRVGVVACGSSLLECAAMDLPFVGVSVVDNQMATARKLEAYWGQPVLLGETLLGSGSALGEAVSKLLKFERSSYSKVDTKGAFRVAEALEVLLG